MSDSKEHTDQKRANSIAEVEAYHYVFDLGGNRTAARVARLVGRGKRVLEVGCGPGSQSRVFKEQLECEVVGIEIDPARAEKARSYCRQVHVADLETVDLNSLLGAERFDVIVCADVLEHLRDPSVLLRKLISHFGDDGYIVVSVPNITHASVVYEMAHGVFDYRPEGLLDSTHVRFFSAQSALALLEDSGYAVVDLERAKKRPEHTEFHTAPATSADAEFLSEILRRNSDGDTYQFVMKALPVSNRARQAKDGCLLLREELRGLRQTVNSYEKEVAKLNSVIEWQEKSILKKIFARLIRK
jgi:2-polyprenyl-3-methyl-5-hydroxy-6-metoxy-1,4-benzoquinol methylase